MEISISGGATTVASDTLTGRAGSATIASGASSKAVTFSGAFTDTSYALITTISNVTDATPINLQIIETARSTTGFTVTFNFPTDTANYVLEYQAVKHE